MRTPSLLALILSLTLAPALAAETVLRPHDPEAKLRPASAERGSLVPKLDFPYVLYLPFFEVDTTDPGGTTTLFAVRNTSSDDLGIGISYLSQAAEGYGQENFVIGAQETVTRNLRDVPMITPGPDGFARGYVAVVFQESPPGEPSDDKVVGDFMQVDVAGNFATGDRMIDLGDICDEVELRILDFGSGTDLRILFSDPQGSDPNVDPPSFTVQVYDESGNALETVDVFTDLNQLNLTAADFTDLDFGTLVFDFSGSGGGHVYGEYSADGKFSVGIDSACIVPLSL